jgi:anti-sigma factor RsiW
MRNDDRSFDENEWTPEERAHIAALSAHRVPPAELKQRTLHALRAQGYIDRRRVPAWIVVGGLIAATLVFGAGALVGYAAASRRSAPSVPTPVAATQSVAQLDSAAKATPATRHVVWY